MASNVTQRLPVDLDQLFQVADEIDYGAESPPCSEAEIVRDAAYEIMHARPLLAALTHPEGDRLKQIVHLENALNVISRLVTLYAAFGDPSTSAKEIAALIRQRVQEGLVWPKGDAVNDTADLNRPADSAGTILPDTRLSYSEALNRVLDGDRARMPHWNIDSWIAFEDGRFVIFRDNTRTACQPRDFETLSEDWVVIPR